MKNPLKQNHEKSLRKALYTEFIVAIFLPIILIDIFFYGVIRNLIYRNYWNEIVNVIESIDDNMDIYFSQLENQIEMVSTADDIHSFLLGDDSTKTSSEYRLASSYINQSFGGRIDISSIRLYNTAGNLLYYRNAPTFRESSEPDQKLLGELRNSTFGCHCFGVRENTGSTVKSTFTLGCQIDNLETGHTDGYIIVNLNSNMITNIVSWHNINGVLKLNYNGQMVFQKSGDLLAAHKSDGAADREDGYAYHSEKTNFTYLVQEDQSLVLQDIWKNILFMLIGNLICFFIFLFLARRWINEICNSLNKLDSYMKDAESNGFDTIAKVRHGSFIEIKRLVNRFNLMQTEVQDLIQKQRDLFQKQAESEYKALQLQITPHFLYNSLDSINCLALIDGKEDISEMIQSLANIFKYTSHNESAFIPLREEVQHVKDYCLLQAVRYQDRFSVVYHIPESYLDREVIKFMLQPLVENAIKYGMNQKKTGGVIEIGIEETEQTDNIYVRDNGNAFDPEKAKEYNEFFQNPRNSKFNFQNRENIGLENVFYRLKYAFGEKAEMQISLKNGTQINLFLPCSLKN